MDKNCAKDCAYKSGNQRRVLLLNLDRDNSEWGRHVVALKQHFAALKWRCVCATSIAEAIHYAERGDINVAIALICEKSHERVFALIDRVMEINSGMFWIAISCDNKFPDYPSTQDHPDYFFDYHHLPFDWPRIECTLGHALGMAMLKKQKSESMEEQGNTSLLGDSPSMQKLKSALRKVTESDATVLINGETGSGKGVCAYWIHEHSKRKNHPFITVNCAALPAPLIQSELFGYEKGAFTGAGQSHIGHIERADKGTLFLDEIGDLNLETQINLLHFLEDNSIERLGGNARRTIDCRILFATHIDLESAVDEGLFREDLYHRLNILQIMVPALRERREDIEMMANHFLCQLKPKGKRFSFSVSAVEAMLRYDWPGNVRELKNRIQRAVVMADGSSISAEDLGLKVIAAPEITRKSKNSADSDIETLLDAIRRNDHNISAAARELNISRTTIYRLVKKYKIKL